MITGIDHPTTGDVLVGSERIYTMSESRRSQWRGRNLGVVFQFFQLLPILTLLENVMLPMDYCNVFSPLERRERAMELLDLVGVADQAGKLPTAVSNGQQQSAAIARALATDPSIIVADEPTGNLDSRSADTILNLFRDLTAAGKTVLIVTHDDAIARQTDQIVTIADGEIFDPVLAGALHESGFHEITHNSQFTDHTMHETANHGHAGDMSRTGGEVLNNSKSSALLKPRWRKVLSDLWGDKTRTLLVVASINVGVFAIGMIISAYVVLGEDFNLGYASANPPNVEFWTDPFDKDLVNAVEKEPGVKAAKGANITSVRARRGGELWQTLDLVGLHDFSNEINRVTPIEGSADAGTEEIAVSQDFLHVTGYHTGDRLEVIFPDDSKHWVVVAGLFKDQTKSKPDPGAANYASITLKTLDRFGQNVEFNRLYVTVEGGGDLAAIAQIAAHIKDQVKKSGRSVYRYEEERSDISPLESLSLTVMNVLLILGILTTILSSTLIINMLNSLLMQQMRQIGVMKLVGGRSRQVMSMYLALISAYGLIALIVAAPLGAVAGYQLALFIATTSGATLQGFRFIPIAILVQALMAFFIPLAAGFAPVKNGARISVQQAISNVRPDDLFSSSGPTQWISEWLSRVSRPFLVSFRNTFRKKGRLLLTIFTLSVAGAVFMAVFNIRGTLEGVLDQLLQHFMGDVTLEFYQDYRIAEIKQVLLETPGVTSVEGWSGAAGEIWDSDRRVVARLSISAPPQNTQLLKIELSAGRWLLPGEDQAIVISDTIRQYYPNLQPGDRLLVKLPGRREKEWTVVGIFPFLSLFGDPIGYANYDFIATQNFTSNQASSYRILTHAADPGAQDTIIRGIEQRLNDQNFRIAKLQSAAAMRETASSAIGMLIGFLLIMAVLIAIVGSLGLAGTMSMNVLERTREIGVMRTIGASDAAIMQSVISEGFLIGIITFVIANVLSFPISSLLAEVIGKNLLQSTLPLHFTPLGILIWLVLVNLLSVIASVAPARNAARLTINEVLAYE